MNRKHSKSNFAPVITDVSRKVSAVSIGSSIYLHGCRDDRFGKNGLGAITVTTSSNREWSTTNENNLVLFTVATRLHAAITDDDTDNQIYQGDPGISGKWVLFRRQHMQSDCH